MCCSLRVAARTARLGLPEAKIGVFPANGGTQRLPRLVGRGRALEMMLTGAPIDAQEAWRIGLVNRVVEPAGLLEAARELMLADPREFGGLRSPASCGASIPASKAASTPAWR